MTKETADRVRQWHAHFAGDPCFKCGEMVVTTAHHFLPKQIIKHFAVQNGYDVDGALWDVRNGCALCVRCHSRHETRTEPLPRRMVPRCAWAFAKELDLDWRLELDYPKEK